MGVRIFVHDESTSRRGIRGSSSFTWLQRLMPILAAVIVVAAALIWRASFLRRRTAQTLRHRRLGPDGVVIGGEGFVLNCAGAPAILLLHGGGDTPQTLRYLADELHARGFHVVAPLLPGHGRSVRDFARVTADDLTRAAFANYEELKNAHPWVGVIGLSMGGALAVQIAAADPGLPVLGLLAPYLAMPPRIARAARLSRVWGLFVPIVHSGDSASVRDPVEARRGLAYGVFTAAGLRALYVTMRRAVDVLPRVAAPTLMIQSREDNRIAAIDAQRAFDRLGATEKRLEWTTGAGHVITVDYGREHVIASMAAWMQAHLPARGSGASRD